MSRKTGVSVQNKFIRGLVTEATALSFPQDACTEVDNVVFDPIGKVVRRKGFDTEANHVPAAITHTPGQTYTSYAWEAVSGDGNVSFLIVQEGAALNFYNVSTSAEVSTNVHATSIDMTDFLVNGSENDPSDYLTQFAAGNGDLIVTNGACDPFYIDYDVSSDTFTATRITLEYRDFAGLEDGLEVDERVTSTLAGLETSNPNHYYNLLNQGWDTSDALTAWDLARTDMPSNADYVALTRANDQDVFDEDKVDANTAGNRPAPKGHFILRVGYDDRQDVLIDDGFTFDLELDTVSLIDRTAGTIIGDFNTRTSAAFDGNLSQTQAVGAVKGSNVADAYIGKNYGAGSEKAIAKVIAYPTSDNGFMTSSSPDDLVINLYASNSLPANGTDGTLLGTADFVDGFSARTILSNDTTTEYRYVWIYINPDDTNVGTICVSEVQFYSNSFTFERPTCSEFYAGRAFYGGINAPGLSNNIYFSQIIESESQYGRCYQKNDPTNEHIPDLLPDDGGVIKIPEMGTLKKLFAYQSALLVFASNGIWLISGSSGSNFKADDYQIKKLSSIGMNAADSLASVKGLPAWWGEDGIYTVAFDANYDSFTPQSLSLQSIDTFYRSIPNANKSYVKGTYDENEQVAYWLYNDDVDLDEDVYRYNSVLCLDAKSQAFYTWSISDGPIVRTIDYIKPADRSNDGKLKFMIHQDYTPTTANQTFAEVLNENYLDWEEEGTEVSYDSYFITGFKLDGETQRFFQPNYVFVFLEQETDASCYMQAIYDYTTNSATGKWSRLQQVYNENLTNRGTNFRRLKVRGKGRALQLRFESESQKPFTIIGWSIWETSNSGL